jgi:hypothetical protein
MITSVRGELIFGTPKTGRSRRTIDLDATTVAILRTHRRVQLEQRMVMGAGWADLDLVFAQPTGEPWKPDTISQAFDRQVAASQIQRIRLHDLRHTRESPARRGRQREGCQRAFGSRSRSTSTRTRCRVSRRMLRCSSRVSSTRCESHSLVVDDTALDRRRRWDSGSRRLRLGGVHPTPRHARLLSGVQRRDRPSLGLARAALARAIKRLAPPSSTRCDQSVTSEHTRRAGDL